MPSKILPINPKPPIISWMKHAYTLSILSTQTTYLPWFYSNYIQLYCSLEKNKPYSLLDFYYPPAYPSLPWLEVQNLNRSLLDFTYPDGIDQFVIAALDQGNYVRLFVDEFYIPGKRAWQRFNFPHKMLVYGYNTASGQVLILGYQQNGAYGPTSISFAQLKQAFYSAALLQRIRDEDQRGEKVHRTNNLAEVWLAKIRPAKCSALDIKILFAQLQDYLLSKDSSERFRMLDTSYYGQTCSGVAIYAYLRETLEAVMGENSLYDPRSLRCLWEHKQCMMARIRYLSTQGILPQESSALNKFGPLVDSAQSIFMLNLKFRLNRDQRLIGRIIKRLDALAKQESVLLHQLSDTLATYA